MIRFMRPSRFPHQAWSEVSLLHVKSRESTILSLRWYSCVIGLKDFRPLVKSDVRSHMIPSKRLQ
jgi:hypothetical protein